MNTIVSQNCMRIHTEESAMMLYEAAIAIAERLWLITRILYIVAWATRSMVLSGQPVK